jgi:hypothetical protein
MELLEVIQQGIETGESELGMFEVLIWFLLMIFGTAVFFIWEYFVKLSDPE